MAIPTAISCRAIYSSFLAYLYPAPRIPRLSRLYYQRTESDLPTESPTAAMSLVDKSATPSCRVQSISEKVEYVLEDEEEQRTLQFILHQGASVYIDTNSLCWNTNGAEVIDKTSIFNHFLAFKNSNISEVRNGSNVPVLLGVGQLSSGKIARVDLFTAAAPGGNMYVCKDNFIGSTCDVCINTKVLSVDAAGTTLFLSPFLMHSYYFIERKELPPNTRAAAGTSCMFMQSSSSILKKQLREGEVLDILLQCLVAFDEGVSLSCVDTAFGRSRLKYLTNKVYVRLTGPGSVYFCSHSSRRLLSNRMSVESKLSQSSLVGLMLHVLVVVLFYYSLNTISARLIQMMEMLRQDG